MMTRSALKSGASWRIAASACAARWAGGSMPSSIDSTSETASRSKRAREAVGSRRRRTRTIADILFGTSGRSRCGYGSAPAVSANGVPGRSPRGASGARARFYSASRGSESDKAAEDGEVVEEALRIEELHLRRAPEPDGVVGVHRERLVRLDALVVDEGPV